MEPVPPKVAPLPPEAPPGWVSFLAASLALGSFVSLGSVAQALHLGWGLWVADAFCFVGVTLAVLRLSGWSPLRLFGLDGASASSLGLGAAVGAVNYAAWTLPLAWVATHVFPKELVDAYDQAKLFEGRSPVELGLIVAAVVLAAPFSEELVFRGVIQGSLQRAVGGPRAVVAAAFLFALFHFNPVVFLPLFALGVVFGLLAWRSGSVWPGIAAHAANNLVTSVLYFASGGARDEDAPAWVAALCFAAGNLLLAALLTFAGRRPHLLASPRPAAPVRVAPPSVGALLAALALPALVSVAALYAFDARGVAVNVAELVSPPPSLGKDASVEAREERAHLDALEQAARRGDVPLEEYREALRQARARPP